MSRFRRLLPTLSLVVTLASCTTPHRAASDSAAPPAHRSAGSNVLETRAFYGIPILQKSFFWDGNGEVDNSGLGLHAAHFLADDVALGLGTNLVNWWLPGRDVQSVDLEALLRLYPVHDWPLFFDGTCGFQQANHQIPPGGTQWNFTFGFGGGVDLPIAEHTSFLLGATYHHISNALGRMNDHNPSQNEARLWLGFTWDF